MTKIKTSNRKRKECSSVTQTDNKAIEKKLKCECTDAHIFKSESELSDKEKEDITIFQCLKCKYFVKSKNPIEHTIYYLDNERFQKLLDKKDSEDKYVYNIDEDNNNPLDFIFENLDKTDLDSDYSEIKKNCDIFLKTSQEENSKKKYILTDLNINCFKTNCKFNVKNEKYYHDLMEQHNKLLDMIKAICKRDITIIKKRHFDFLTKYNLNIIAYVFEHGYIDNDLDMDHECFICFNPHKYSLIKQPCLCKTKIHLECFLSVFDTIGHRCKTCARKYDYIYKNPLFIFPNLNLIYILDPDRNSKSKYLLIPDDNVDMALLHYIKFGLIEQIKKIIDKMSDKEFMAFFDKANKNQIKINIGLFAKSYIEKYLRKKLMRYLIY